MPAGDEEGMSLENRRREIEKRLNVLSQMVIKKTNLRTLNTMEHLVNQAELIDAIRDHAVQSSRREFFSKTPFGKDYERAAAGSRERLSQAIRDMRRGIDMKRAEQLAGRVENGHVFAHLKGRAAEQNMGRWLREFREKGQKSRQAA